MKVDEVERLLAAYYEGATDEHEEKRLKEALLSQDLPEHLESDGRLLAALEAENMEEIPVPAGLEERLSCLIDRKDEEAPHFLRRNRVRRNWRWVVGIAATFLLLTVIGWGVSTMDKQTVPPTPLDTFSDPQEAYQVLQATLSEMSSNWRAGLEQMQEVQLQMNVVQKEVKQELSK